MKTERFKTEKKNGEGQENEMVIEDKKREGSE